MEDKDVQTYAEAPEEGYGGYQTQSSGFTPPVNGYGVPPGSYGAPPTSQPPAYAPYYGSGSDEQRRKEQMNLTLIVVGVLFFFAGITLIFFQIYFIGIPLFLSALVAILLGIINKDETFGGFHKGIWVAGTCLGTTAACFLLACVLIAFFLCCFLIIPAIAAGSSSASTTTSTTTYN